MHNVTTLFKVIFSENCNGNIIAYDCIHILQGFRGATSEGSSV